MKKKDELNVQQVNEVVKLSKKILDVFYILLIIGGLFIITLLVKETGILKFTLNILKVITPLFIGFGIAWILDPIVRKLCAKGVHRTTSALIVFIIFVGIILGFFGFLFPVVYDQLIDLIDAIPTIAKSIEGMANGIFEKLKVIEGLDVNSIKTTLFTNIGELATSITTDLPSTLINLVKGIFSGIGIILISMIVALYMMIDFDETSEHFIKLVPKRYHFNTKQLIDKIAVEIRKTVNGTFFVAGIVFIVTSIGFTLIGLKAPLLFGMFSGITNIIPYIGPWIGGAAALVVAFSQSTITGVLTILVVLIVQMLENMILQPLVMSKTMKLHPVTIIIGLLIFGNLFGIVGMILATPAMALIKVLIQFIKIKFNLFED